MKRMHSKEEVEEIAKESAPESGTKLYLHEIKWDAASIHLGSLVTGGLGPFYLISTSATIIDFTEDVDIFTPNHFLFGYNDDGFSFNLLSYSKAENKLSIETALNGANVEYSEILGITDTVTPL